MSELGEADLNDADRSYMARALEIAERGRGHVSPNPMVGAVIVKGDHVVAEGYHQKFGDMHAEIMALNQAGDAAEGATLYVSLEPCAHQGKTGPCVERIVNAGIAQVVVAIQDPNPLVNGKGLKFLRGKGVLVKTGLMEDSARELIAGYHKFITIGRPLVTLKVAQTIDGRIATSSGHAKWITSAESRTEAHRIRSQHDVLLIGINTILADDPQLSVRHVKAVSPRRMVLDSQLRVPLDANIFSDASPEKTIIISTAAASKEKIARIEEKGARVWILPEDQRGWVDQSILWRTLAEKGVTSVLLEGGSTLHTECLKNQIVDRAVIFIAPKILGTGIDAIGDLGIRNINSAISLKQVQIKQLNGDLRIMGQVCYND